MRIQTLFLTSLICSLTACSSETNSDSPDSTTEKITLDHLNQSFTEAKGKIRQEHREKLAQLILADVDRIQLDRLGEYSKSYPKFGEEEIDGVKVFPIVPYERCSFISKTVNLTGQALVRFKETLSTALREGSDASMFGHTPSVGITCFKSDERIVTTSLGFKTKNFFIIYPGGELDYDWIQIDANLTKDLTDAISEYLPD